MISFEIDKKQFEKLLAKLSAIKQDETIMPALEESAEYIRGWIVKERLAGPRPTYLGVVTGRLSSSITRSSAEKISGGYEVRIGTNVEYAPIHEFGFSGIVSVKSFLKGKGSSVSTRNMNMPARPFMRPGIEDEGNQKMVLDTLIERIEKAVEQV